LEDTELEIMTELDLSSPVEYGITAGLDLDDAVQEVLDALTATR